MKDLHDVGLIARLPVSTFSDSHPRKMGVPQGTILSVTLFSVKINITLCLKPGINCSLYVDDFQVYYRPFNIESELPLCLNKFQQ